MHQPLEPDLAEIDEALGHLSVSWQVARNAHAAAVAERDRARLDDLLDARLVLRPRVHAPA